MRLATVVGSGMALLATATLAAPGDHLVVTGAVVNVRAGPGTDYRVRLQVYRKQAVVELAREGRWVRVELSERAEEGWVHQSLLEAARGARPAGASAGRGAPAAQREPVRGTGELALPSVRTLRLSELPSPGTEPREPGSKSQALAHFRSNVSMLNERALAAAGVELFTGVERSEGATVRVLVTEAWEMVPAAGQQSYTNALFSKWQAAVGDSGSLRVQLVDPSGAVVSEKSVP